MLDTDLLDLVQFNAMLCRLVEMLQVIVITAPGDFGYYQEAVQGVFLP